MGQPRYGQSEYLASSIVLKRGEAATMAQWTLGRRQLTGKVWGWHVFRLAAALVKAGRCPDRPFAL